MTPEEKALILKRRLDSIISLRDSIEEFLMAWESSFDSKDLAASMVMARKFIEMFNACPNDLRLNMTYTLLVIMERDLKHGIEVLVNTTLT